MEYDEELRQVSCKNREITYKLIRKPVKNINLRVKLDGSITVSANETVSAAYIDDFIQKKESYIIKACNKFKEYRKYIPKTKKYVSGESFGVLGKELRLKVLEDNQESVKSDGVFIYLKVCKKENFKRKEKLMDMWFRNMQQDVFLEICNEIYPTFKKYGVDLPKLKIRHMASHWGTCHPQKGTITLNSRLIAVPRNCIEYVVLHEFVHFIHPNHSKEFWNFVVMLMPDWKERKMELEKYSFLEE